MRSLAPICSRMGREKAIFGSHLERTQGVCLNDSVSTLLSTLLGLSLSIAVM